MQRIPVLVITGPVGVGKTTTAAAVSYLLAQQGIRHAYVDHPQIGNVFPVRDDDPWNADLAWRNLACMWSNFRAVGAERLIVSAVVTFRSYVERLSEVVPGAEITVVRLRAPLPTIHTRIRARNQNPDWFLNAATELSAEMDAQALQDHVIENDAMTIDETATAVLRAVGWA